MLPNLKLRYPRLGYDGARACSLAESESVEVMMRWRGVAGYQKQCCWLQLWGMFQRVTAIRGGGEGAVEGESE